LLRTIAVPTPAYNLSVANGEFDQAVLTKRKHWGVRFRDYRVSKSKQGDFNRQSDQANLCLFGGPISYQPTINLAEQDLQVKSIL
jgi:hypothetical protein